MLAYLLMCVASVQRWKVRTGELLVFNNVPLGKRVQPIIDTKKARLTGVVFRYFVYELYLREAETGVPPDNRGGVTSYPDTL